MHRVSEAFSALRRARSRLVYCRAEARDPMSNIYGWPDGLVVELVGGPRDGERQRGPHGNALPCGSSHYLPFVVTRPKRTPRYVYRWLSPLEPAALLDELQGLGFFLVDPCGKPGTRP